MSVANWRLNTAGAKRITVSLGLVSYISKPEDLPEMGVTLADSAPIPSQIRMAETVLWCPSGCLTADEVPQQQSAKG